MQKDGGRHRRDWARGDSGQGYGALLPFPLGLATGRISQRGLRNWIGGQICSRSDLGKNTGGPWQAGPFDPKTEFSGSSPRSRHPAEILTIRRVEHLSQSSHLMTKFERLDRAKKCQGWTSCLGLCICPILEVHLHSLHRQNSKGHCFPFCPTSTWQEGKLRALTTNLGSSSLQLALSEQLKEDGLDSPALTVPEETQPKKKQSKGQHGTGSEYLLLSAVLTPSIETILLCFP